MTQQNTKINVKEIFGPTIQGEGLYVGLPAIFIRLEGCNIWNGSKETKAKSMCPYCDTDFINGKEMTVKQIIKEVKAICDDDEMLVVLTGGEPLIQDIRPLCEALHDNDYKIQIETNGTKDFKMAYVSVSMSPKVPADKIKLEYCDTLKVLYPHPNKSIRPEDYDNDNWGYKYKSLQPIDEEGKTKENTDLCVQKVIELGDGWRVGLQIHKILGVE